MKKSSVVALFALLIAFVLAANAQQRGNPKFSDWAPVVHLPPPINSEFDDQAAVMSKDEKTMYFSSNRPGSMGGSRDIWVSTRKTKNSDWGTPVNLGAPINSPGTELVRSLTSDGRVLLFQSDRSAGGFGLSDIWAVSRQHVNDDSGWSEPVNLGAAINTPYTELAASYLFADSGRVKKLFYSSNKPLTGFGGPDIYETTITDLGFETSVNVFELNTPSIETCF
ncbi:MAG TPA: hypothetical protein VMZ26_13095, partial [Pyrinomonadaceae bacterium]|nr:hypothetical protein [Pyrinomonadaceae bacterium]